jgi:HAD superfamily hydrolase (TIGR01509 family)
MSTGPHAVIFDCDGVLADTEPLHLWAFREVLAPLGLTIGDAEYSERYLGFDDRGFFDAILRARGRAVAPAEIARLIAEKARRLRSVLEAETRVYPGVVDFVRSLKGIPLAVASGALRAEVEIVLGCAGIGDAFAAVVAAEDVRAGKPDPEGFLLALAALDGGAGVLTPNGCLVVEDSHAGVEAARRAGMRCLAVTNSHPAVALGAADLVVPTLEGLTLARVRSLFSGSSKED